MALVNDLKNLRVSGAASADELREFVAKMKGRSPQEVLGLVADSSLFQSTLQATIGTIVLTAIFTVVPYMLAKNNPPQKATAAAKTNDAKSADANADSANKQETPAANQANAAAPNANQPAENVASSGNTNVDKAAKAMGIGETKASDPKKNPLENNLDKLLDDVK